MDLSFEKHAYNNLLEKAGIVRIGKHQQFYRILFPFLICWLPLAIITLFSNYFWTGNVADSFITNIATQGRLLVALPILILSEKLVSNRLGKILDQFINSGIIRKENKEEFDTIIVRRTNFLNSSYTDLVVIIICYIQVFISFHYQLENYNSLLSWQTSTVNGISTLNFAGWWNNLISMPFFLFLLYRWILRLFVWSIVLYKTSKLNLNLYAMHPDKVAGLGFLGFALRYFAPVAFAFSAIVAGEIADLIQIDGYHLHDFNLTVFGYFVFITLLFTLPLFSFTSKLLNTQEKSVFENYDLANGFYRELEKKWSIGYNEVKKEDLDKPDFSTVNDLSSIMDSVLGMNSLPFTIKNLIPLWFMTLLPFVPVLILEIPLVDILKKIFSIVI